MRVDPVVQAHRPVVVAVAAVVPLGACAILAVFRDSIENTNAALGLVLLVVAAASTGIRSAGIAAALSGAAGFDFFLTEPYNRLTISDPADVETTVLLLLVGAAVTEIALWGRREQAMASRERGYLDGVSSTASLVAAGGSSIDELIDQVCRQIVDVLEIDGCRFDWGLGSALPTLEPTGAVTRNGQSIDVARYGLPTDSTIALRVRSAGVSYGHLVLTAATRVRRPAREQLRIAVTLADQLGAALGAVDTGKKPARGE